jgi:MraZ protein
MSATTENVRVSFKGEYDFGVDDKRRIQIPAKWRPAEGTVLSVHVWKAEGQKHPCLLVLPPATARKLEEKLEGMAFSDPKAEALRRLLGADCDDLTLDSAGRICLPEKLAGKANISKKAVLVGLFDRFQIWHPEHYTDTQVSDAVLRSDAIKLV